MLEAAAVATIIPLAPFLNRYMPPILVGEWNLDLMLSIVVAFVLTRLLLIVFKPLTVPVLFLVIGLFAFNFFTKGYSFKDVIQDYQSTVVKNWGTKDRKQEDFLNIYPAFFLSYYDKTSRGIRTKVNYRDSVVRNFSVKQSLLNFDEYFNKYGPLVRHLSLFKYINSHFKYVSDSQRDEYFAFPRETIRNGLGGDCDDHSILMVSCLQSIGARCRIVLIEGHAYPELYCGTREEFESMQQAIIHCFDQLKIKEFHYHEHEGAYWINLDYTAHRPGSPYLNDKMYALIES